MPNARVPNTFRLKQSDASDLEQERRMMCCEASAPKGHKLIARGESPWMKLARTQSPTGAIAAVNPKCNVHPIPDCVAEGIPETRPEMSDTDDVPPDSPDTISPDRDLNNSLRTRHNHPAT